MTGAAEIRETAIRLLARREHSRRELFHKLSGRGHAADDIDAILDELESERLLSDERYAEAYARMRSERGYGPLRIRSELAERGVAEPLIEQAFWELGADWEILAAQTRQRKFGESLPDDFKQQAKQKRFLQYRGFEHSQIRSAMRSRN